MRSSFKFFLVAIFLAMFVAPAVFAERTCRNRGEDKDWHGSKIKTVNGISGGIDGCIDLCKKNSKCKKWSYSGSKFGNGCSLYKAGAKAKDFSCQCAHAYGTCI